MFGKIRYWIASFSILIIASIGYAQTNEDLLQGGDKLLPIKQLGNAQTNKEILQGEYAKVEEEITSLRQQIDSTDEPAANQLMGLRLEILLLTQAILQNRLLILEGEGINTLTVTTSEPDLTQVGPILSDMAEVEKAITDAESSLANSVGIDSAIITTRIESEKLALAQLRIAYIAARYGSTSSVENTSVEDQDKIISDERLNDNIKLPIWADRDYPEIDYTHNLFRRAFESGATISGWWTLTEDRKNNAIVAQNLSSLINDAEFSEQDTQLIISCTKNSYEVSVSWSGRSLRGFVSDNGSRVLEGTYRIDGGVPVREDWQTEVGGYSAILSQASASAFIEDLSSSNRLDVEFLDSRNSDVASEINLSGFDVVEEFINNTCVDSTIILNKADYLLVQTLLNIAGFNPGQPDGIWGRRSQQAMKNYQQTVDLPATGEVDRPTLRLLGLIE